MSVAVPLFAAWNLSLYPSAGEAGGCFVSTSRPRRTYSLPGQGQFPERAQQEAARRARCRVRRYCAANGLNRLGTLTYRGDGCHDPRKVRVDIGAFFRSLRSLLGGSPLPYLWVPEWHPGGHGLHVHFAVGRYIQRGVIEQAWPHGFVHIKALTDLPIGSGKRTEARRAAAYLSKYVSKAFDVDLGGLHRYEVGQGFTPTGIRLKGVSVGDVLDQATVIMDGLPSVQWDSRDEVEWHGPPAVWFAWD